MLLYNSIYGYNKSQIISYNSSLGLCILSDCFRVQCLTEVNSFQSAFYRHQYYLHACIYVWHIDTNTDTNI